MELSPVLFTLYVIPGFIAVSVRDLLIPRRPRGELAFLAEVVCGSGAILGGVYALAWLIRFAPPQVSQLLHLLPPHPFAVREDTPPWALLAIAVGLAFLTGIAWAKWEGSPIRKALLLRTTGVALDPYPTVWPVVAQWAKREWVAVQLQNGTRYGGWIAKYSNEGDDRTDLVLDDAAVLDTDNQSIRKVTGGMVYIRLSAVASIEFLTRSGYSPPRESASQ